MSKIDPIKQFEVRKFFSIDFFGYEIGLDSVQFISFIIPFFILAVSFLFKFNNAIFPTRLQVFIEQCIKKLDEIIDTTLDKTAEKYKSFVFSLFCFILFANLIGLIPNSFAITSHISITFALSFLVFGLTLMILFFRHGIFFAKVFVPAGTPLWLAPLLFILESFSFFIRPISLSIRLSANIIAGHVMLEVLAFFVVMMKVFGFLPFAFLLIMTGFEFFVAFLQSYIFAIFTCVYINEALHH